MLSAATAVGAVALAMAGMAGPAPFAGNLGTGSFQGKATFTEDYKPDFNVVACPKSDHLKTLPKEFITGLNAPQFDQPKKNENCGVILEVTGPKGKIKVQIVDRAAGPKKGDLNLDKAAFAKIANVDDGIVKITWQVAK